MNIVGSQTCSGGTQESSSKQPLSKLSSKIGQVLSQREFDCSGKQAYEACNMHPGGKPEPGTELEN